MPPPIRYARAGEHNIAYQVHGDGPVDILFATGLISHLETLWDEPGLVRLFDSYADFGRLILMDRRGMGMSDPLDGPVALQEEIADADAVLDAVGSTSAALFGYTAGGPFVLQYAASRPERVRALILYAAFARATRADDMPWAPSEAEREERLGQLIDQWGAGSNLALLAPSASGDPSMQAWFARLERLAAAPGQMRTLARMLGAVDVRDLLSDLRVPTLVLHRTGDLFIDPRHSRYLASRIPGAKLVELPGDDNFPWVGDADAVTGEIEEFLTGGRHHRQPQRALLTVLFTDICDGTAKAAEVGDRRWRDLLAAHDAAVRRELVRFGGREVKTIGDGFLATFEGPPGAAVRCARAIVAAAGPVGVAVRVGLHTGECEIIGDDVGGMAVHIAARVSALAGPGEVFASGTTYGTVVGSGLPFEDRGGHELKGVPGRWPIFRVG